MINIRYILLPARLLTLLLLLSIIASEADDPPPKQSLDAVCKVDPMPVGFVAVGEMESSECKLSAPGSKNAWLIDKVRDNIISCAAPNYAYGYPPAIGYMICESVLTDSCPGMIDGTPNGLLLTTPTSCRSAKVSSECLDYNLAHDSLGRGSRLTLSIVMSNQTCKSSHDIVYYADELQLGDQFQFVQK
jgi:hypothetical protein